MVLMVTFEFELNVLKIKFSFFSVNGLLIKFCEYFQIRLLYLYSRSTWKLIVLSLHL